jgi:hypothetical protein
LLKKTQDKLGNHLGTVSDKVKAEFYKIPENLKIIHLKTKMHSDKVKAKIQNLKDIFVHKNDPYNESAVVY